MGHNLAIFDLHTHSNCSDGVLAPRELVRLAHEAGVTHLALTDHDSINGLEEAGAEAAVLGMSLINGVELSCRWRDREIHLVALGFDEQSPELLALLAIQQQRRIDRAKAIALKLARKGFGGTFEAASAIAGEGVVTRPHFAEHLVNIKAVRNPQEAFRLYLGRHKAAFCETQWVDLQEAIRIVKQAEGISVLAHPLKYKFSNGRFKSFIDDFKAFEGQAIEVCSGLQSRDQRLHLTKICKQYGFLASVGSDFHRPQGMGAGLGRSAMLAAELTPVWQYLSVDH